MEVKLTELLCTVLDNQIEKIKRYKSKIAKKKKLGEDTELYDELIIELELQLVQKTLELKDRFLKEIEDEIREDFGIIPLEMYNTWEPGPE